MDARRVERILRNLLGNALDHGEGKPVVITVGCDDDAVAVTVRDHGVGLRPGEAGLVFNRFWRGDPSRSRLTGGTGLGLAISLEDARLHDGWLQAWGERGRGAQFRLTLPRRAGHTLMHSPLPLDPDETTRTTSDASRRSGAPRCARRVAARRPLGARRCTGVPTSSSPQIVQPIRSPVGVAVRSRPGPRRPARHRARLPGGQRRPTTATHTAARGSSTPDAPQPWSDTHGDDRQRRRSATYDGGERRPSRGASSARSTSSGVYTPSLQGTGTAGRCRSRFRLARSGVSAASSRPQRGC